MSPCIESSNDFIRGHTPHTNPTRSSCFTPITSKAFSNALFSGVTQRRSPLILREPKPIRTIFLPAHHHVITSGIHRYNTVLHILQIKYDTIFLYTKYCTWKAFRIFLNNFALNLHKTLIIRHLWLFHRSNFHIAVGIKSPKPYHIMAYNTVFLFCIKRGMGSYLFHSSLNS